MSRTYRKTKSKQGAPKWSQRGFNKYQLSMIDIPLPKRVPNKYVLIHEVVQVPSSREAPTNPKDPRWVTKGVPGAIAERVPAEGTWWTCETGRYYLPTKGTTKEVTRHRLVRDRTHDNRDDWREECKREWDHQQIFGHVYLNQCGRSQKRKTNRYNKRQDARKLRREGRDKAHNWEHEYTHTTNILNPTSGCWTKMIIT